jgi:hypothetical protein
MQESDPNTLNPLAAFRKKYEGISIERNAKVVQREHRLPLLLGIVSAPTHVALAAIHAPWYAYLSWNVLILALAFLNYWKHRHVKTKGRRE